MCKTRHYSIQPLEAAVFQESSTTKGHCDEPQPGARHNAILAIHWLGPPIIGTKHRYKFPLCQLHAVCCQGASLLFWPTAHIACRCLKLSRHEASLGYFCMCQRYSKTKSPASHLYSALQWAGRGGSGTQMPGMGCYLQWWIRPLR